MSAVTDRAQTDMAAAESTLARWGRSAARVIPIVVVAVGLLYVLLWLLAIQLPLGAGFSLEQLLPNGILPSQQQGGAWPLGSQVVSGVLGVVRSLTQIFAMTVLMVIILFFYLKDGRAITNFLQRLFPSGRRDDVAEVGKRAWTTIGQYFRGQLLVALVDAVLIGVGLIVVGVPLVLPLAIVTFLGGLFPIVGALVAGAMAVLVALASAGLTKAVIVLGIVVAVQQIEGNVLAPFVLGDAVSVHPLGIILRSPPGACSSACWGPSSPCR